MEDLIVSVPRLLPLIFGIMAIFVSQHGMAKTYKWVDENGVTQYTQTPPPKGDFKAVKPLPKPAISPEDAKKQLQERVDAFQQRRDDAGKAKTEASKEKVKSAKKSADCAKSKDNLSYFEANSRVKYKDKDGNVTLMPEEERQKKMQTMRDNIKKLCN